MRKAQDDPIARTVAENQLADILDIEESANPGSTSHVVLGAFEAVEFEKAASKVGGKDIYLRRLVITGAWEVDPNGVK